MANLWWFKDFQAVFGAVKYDSQAAHVHFQLDQLMHIFLLSAGSIGSVMIKSKSVRIQVSGRWIMRHLLDTIPPRRYSYYVVRTEYVPSRMQAADDHLRRRHGTHPQEDDLLFLFTHCFLPLHRVTYFVRFYRGRLCCVLLNWASRLTQPQRNNHHRYKHDSLRTKIWIFLAKCQNNSKKSLNKWSLEYFSKFYELQLFL